MLLDGPGWQTLNIAALPVAVLAILIYAQVKNVPEETAEGSPSEKQPLNGGQIQGHSDAVPEGKKAPAAVGEWPKRAPIPRIASARQTIALLKLVWHAPGAGMVVACVAGVLFGACFNPAQHVIDQATANHCAPIADECACIDYVALDDRRIYCTWDPTWTNGTAGSPCGG